MKFFCPSWVDHTRSSNDCLLLLMLPTIEAGALQAVWPRSWSSAAALFQHPLTDVHVQQERVVCGGGRPLSTRLSFFLGRAIFLSRVCIFLSRQCLHMALEYFFMMTLQHTTYIEM